MQQVLATSQDKKTEFDRDKLYDYVVTHEMGKPTEAGYTLGKELIDAGDDYSTAAHEVVSRKLTTEFHQFKVGDRVYWNDPDDHETSGFGRITHLQHELADAVITVAKDDGGEVEALPSELSDEKRYYSIAIIGRIPGDDKDSCYVYENMSESEALKAFTADIYDDKLVEKEHGVTVFHNMTLVSDSPIAPIY